MLLNDKYTLLYQLIFKNGLSIGYKNSVEITYPFFSTPKTAVTFASEILENFITFNFNVNPQKSNRKGDRTFDDDIPKGGFGIDPSKCAILCIEFQNEFTTEGGKLYNSVKENMEANGMLEKSSKLAQEMRKVGVKIFHAPISFESDGSDNPNRNLGILAGCYNDQLFIKDSWNAQICQEMTPHADDVIVKGRQFLSVSKDER